MDDMDISTNQNQNNDDVQNENVKQNNAQNVDNKKMCADSGKCAEGPHLADPTEASNTNQDEGKIYDL